MTIGGLPVPPWQGDNPLYLVIILDNGMGVVLDLDEPGWMESYSDFRRKPGVWYLTTKGDNSVLMGLKVAEGERAYYAAKHIGIASAVTGERKAEVTAYGLGKKRLDGHTDRLWILPDGLYCTGDDVESFALEGIKGGRY